MSPEFATAVDPVFTYVLSVMDEIESGRTPLPEDVSSRIRGFIDQAENRLGKRDDWELAKYALIAWVDDLLIEAPWEGRAWWEQNRMEFQVFRTAEAFTKFYLQANLATEQPRKDALEVFYVCVVLGFRGLYGDPSAVSHAADFGLPSTLEEWARRTSMSIQLGQGRPDIREQGRPGPGAPPLEGKYLLIGTGLSCVLLTAVAMFTAWQVFGSSG
jgi:type VI secretion system protein ImpK